MRAKIVNEGEYGKDNNIYVDNVQEVIDFVKADWAKGPNNPKGKMYNDKMQISGPSTSFRADGTLYLTKATGTSSTYFSLNDILAAINLVDINEKEVSWIIRPRLTKYEWTNIKFINKQTTSQETSMSKMYNSNIGIPKKPNYRND